jgi:hypothetical protein
LLLPLAARRAGARFVSTLHSLDGPPRWGRAGRAALLPLLLGSDSVVVCSERQRRALSRLPGGLGRRVALVPVGATVLPDGARPATRVPGPLRFIYFGFVWRGRNIETLLRALAAVPEATLDVAGGIRDAAYHDELVALAERSGVAGRVRFRGDLPAPKISRALHEADVALLPFATGASTGRTTLMAAFAHGLPVVTMAAPDNVSPLFTPARTCLPRFQTTRTGLSPMWSRRPATLFCALGWRPARSRSAAPSSGRKSPGKLWLCPRTRRFWACPQRRRRTDRPPQCSKAALGDTTLGGRPACAHLDAAA